MAFAAGELPLDRHALIESHLARCPQCGLEARRFVASMGASQTVPVSACPASLLEEIRSWEYAHAYPDRDVNEIKSRVEREIAPYIGNKAAARVMELISPGGEDLLARIETVLTLFLGCAAAAELTSRIVDRSIVRP